MSDIACFVKRSLSVWDAYSAGKSTLLQLLASRKLNAGLGAGFSSSGEILFNGQVVDKNARSQVAFVEQEDDYHLPALTVSYPLRGLLNRLKTSWALLRSERR